jgi:citrate lyase subunit beta/citryl-CoA lyase
MLARAAGLAADLLIVDLEDSVAPEVKGDEVRRAAAAALVGGVRARTRAVRVNAVGSPPFLGDLETVVRAGPGAVEVVVVPKVADETHVWAVHHVLGSLEGELGLPPLAIGLEAQIETASGMSRVAAIAAAAPGRLEALVFGPGDYAASLGMPQTTIGAGADGYPGHVFHHALSEMVVAARANGLQAVDGPYARIRDTDGLRRSADLARALGLDGKWSVHPDQVPVLNEIFGVSEDDLARAREILDTQAEGTARRRGASELHGEMIDEATRRMAESLVRRAASEAAPGGASHPP